MTIFASKTQASKEANLKFLEKSELEQVTCIYYSIQFNEFSVKALIDLDSKVNVMQSSFIRKPSPRICKTNVDAQKIDSSRLEVYRIIITLF